MRLFVACWVTVLWVAAPALAQAQVSGALEGALELDSNVRRIETSDLQEPTTAPLTRLAGRLELVEPRLGGGDLVAVAAGQLRTALREGVTSENVALLSLDGQWLRPARDGVVAYGPRLAYRDAVALADASGDRAFRSASAELVGVLRGPSARFTVSAGPRLFQYKANDASTWRGGGAAARGDFALWRGGVDQERTLDLAVIATVEQRAYRATAFTNVCAPGEAISARCFLATPRRRGDRMHRVSARLVYVGGVVASAEDQLTVVDSNSFGRSWIGNRLRAAVTLPIGPAFVTGTATVQLERYTDGLLVARDPEQGLFETLEDDNRSSLEARLALPLSACVSLELRAASWRELFGDVEYRRSLGSLGLVWTE